LVAYKLKLLENLRIALSLDDEENCVSEIKEVLAKNALFIKDNALCYTALPEDDVTLLLCEIATWMEHCTKEPALMLLLPGIATDSLGRGYVDLTELPLKEVLRTHVVSKCGNYVFPVRALLEIELESGLNKKILNPYFDFEKEGEYCCELQRLYEHSATAKALYEAKLHYHELLKQDDSLYSQLIKLTLALYINGAAGVGSEDDAAGGAYPAIIRFNEYYAMLNDEQKEQIPDRLKEEIEKLIDLSTDSTVNIRATQQTETCIDTRQKALKAAMQGNDEFLMQIRLSKNTKQELLNAQRNKFNQCHNLLKNELIECKYSGVDKLPLTTTLLNALDIVPQVTCMDELNDLMDLSPNELAELLNSHPQLANQIAAQFTNIEPLVMFLIEQNHEHLAMVLPKIKNGLFVDQARIPEDLAACLIALEGEKFNLVCQALLGDIERPLIRSARDFGLLLTHLTHEQRIQVYEHVMHRATNIPLLSTIKTPYDLKCVLRYLTPEQCAQVCLALKENFHEIIKTPYRFSKILQDLTQEQRTQVYETAIYDTAKKQLLISMKTPYELKYILRHLTQEQRTQVYETVKTHLLSSIKTPKDLGYVLVHLTSEQCAQVCLTLKEQRRLLSTIETPENFACVLKILTPEQCAQVCHALKVDLHKIISTPSKFACVFQELFQEQRTQVYEAVKPQLLSTIETSYDLDALKYLTQNQRTQVYQVVKERLFSTLKTPYDLARVLTLLTPEQCAQACHDLKERLHKIIKTPENFRNTLIFLTPQQRTQVYEAVKPQLQTQIKTPEHLACVLMHLSQEQRTQVYESVIHNADKKPLLIAIKTPIELECILRCLTSDQCSQVCQDLKENLHKIIKTPEDIGNLFQYFTQEQRTQVYKTVIYDTSKNKLLITIKTPSALACVLRHLTCEQCTQVCQALKGRLHDIIKTPKSLECVLRHLTPELCAQVCQALKENFHEIIKTPEDFLSALIFLAPEQRAQVYEAVKAYLSNIIQDESTLEFALQYLTPKQRLEVVISIRDRLDEMLGDEEQIHAFLARYNITLPAHAAEDMGVDHQPNVLLFSNASRQSDAQEPEPAPTEHLNRPRF